MPNMSYCRFENTFHDFSDCYYALEEYSNLDDIQKELSDIEFKFLQSLIKMSDKMVKNYGDLLKSHEV